MTASRSIAGKPRSYRIKVVLIFSGLPRFRRSEACPRRRSYKTVKFLGKVIGSFLQLVAVSMNWCEMRSIDSLWWSLKIQWQGVGTLQD